jgi:hypothetical protein
MDGFYLDPIIDDDDPVNSSCMDFTCIPKGDEQVLAIEHVVERRLEMASPPGMKLRIGLIDEPLHPQTRARLHRMLSLDPRLEHLEVYRGRGPDAAHVTCLTPPIWKLPSLVSFRAFGACVAEARHLTCIPPRMEELEIHFDHMHEEKEAGDDRIAFTGPGVATLTTLWCSMMCPPVDSLAHLSSLRTLFLDSGNHAVPPLPAQLVSMHFSDWSLYPPSIRHLHNLKHVSLAPVTSRMVRLPSQGVLETLAIKCWHVDSLDSLSYLPCLRRLRICDGPTIEELPALPATVTELRIERMPRLTRVVLSTAVRSCVIHRCTGVTDVDMRGACGLELLYVSELPGLIRLDLPAEHLSTLSLGGCDAMCDLPPLPSSLETLRMCAMPRVMAVHLAGLPRLHEFAVERCEALDTIYFDAVTRLALKVVEISTGCLIRT